MDPIKEFMNPKSMLTPGVAGGMTMLISNALYSNFGLPQAWSGLAVSALFGVLVISTVDMALWQRTILWFLNSLVVFSMATGVNTAGTAASTPPPRYPHGAFSYQATPRGASGTAGNAVLPTLSRLALISNAYVQVQTQEERLIRGTGPEVFFVVNGQRRWIPNPQTLNALGFSPQEIRTVPDPDLQRIPKGQDYPPLASRVVKGSGPEVYLLEHGRRRWIPDPQTFEAMGLRWDSLRVIPDEDLRAIPEGAPIPRKFFAPWFHR